MLRFQCETSLLLKFLLDLGWIRAKSRRAVDKLEGLATGHPLLVFFDTRSTTVGPDPLTFGLVSTRSLKGGPTDETCLLGGDSIDRTERIALQPL